MFELQLSPSPQSELLWQGSDSHVPAGPPSPATPRSWQSNPLGQSVATEHARAAACRADDVIAATAENVRIEKKNCPDFIAWPSVSLDGQARLWPDRNPFAKTEPEGAASKC